LRGNKDDLQRWDAGDSIPGSLVGRVQSHPRFAAAVHLLARNMLALSDTDKTLDGIFKDAGRYVAAMWAMYLYASGGLTVPRLKEICASSGLVSPGRARALLLYMRYLGYVVALPKQRRGDVASYAPTESFLASWREHLRAALQAAEQIEPAVGFVLGRLHEPAVLERVSRIQSEGLLAWAREGDQQEPFVRVFMHPHAGNQIVWTLFSAIPDGAFPPQGPLTFSIGAAAKRFGVSRTHIRRMIDAAARENLIVYAEDGTIEFQQGAREILSRYYATQILQLLITAARATAHFDATSQPERAAAERVA
jgi:hypothetical protein